MDTLFTCVDTVTLDERGTVLHGAFVGVRDGKICHVGPERPKEAAAREIDGRGKVLMPGLINAHTHLPMTLLRGCADDYNLQIWLFDYIFPAEARMDDRAARAGAYLAAAEAMASGTVSVSDMYDHCGAIAEALAESGLMANLSRAVLCTDGQFDARTDARMRDACALCDTWHGYDRGRIRVDASVHAEYTSSRPVWEAVAAFAHERNIGVHVHVSETKREHDESVARNGHTPTAALDKAGIFDTRAIAAHGVWLTEDDMDILAARGASVAHCPVSNLKLASGVADIAALRRHGVNVALGTDGTASNNTLELWEEVKLAALLAKNAARDPGALHADDALRLAVTGGAYAQGRERETGQVAVGFDADIILLDFEKPHLTPCFNIASHLAYAARGGDVVLTMVRGRILYRDGEFLTIDMERVLHELRTYAVPRVRGGGGL